MSPIPAQMTSHWWQRPGRRPGREQYHWHMLFHDQPAARELVAAAQARIAGLTGLDLVSLVAQTQVGRSWQWRPVAEVILGSAD